MIAGEAEAPEAGGWPRQQMIQYGGTFRSAVDIVAKQDDPLLALRRLGVRGDQPFHLAQERHAAMDIADGVDQLRAPVEEELLPSLGSIVPGRKKTPEQLLHDQVSQT